MKEAVTKVIDTFTQEDFHGDFQKLLEWYKKGISGGGDYFEEFHVCTINKSAHTKKVWKLFFNDPRMYIYIYIYKSKVVDRSRVWYEGCLFDSYYTKV